MLPLSLFVRSESPVLGSARCTHPALIQTDTLATSYSRFLLYFYSTHPRILSLLDLKARHAACPHGFALDSICSRMPTIRDSGHLLRSLAKGSSTTYPGCTHLFSASGLGSTSARRSMWCPLSPVVGLGCRYDVQIPIAGDISSYFFAPGCCWAYLQLVLMVCVAAAADECPPSAAAIRRGAG